MKVLKFGGTSVSTKERLQTICDIVSREEEQVIVVVSAIRGVTDLLLSLLSANKLQQRKILKEIRNLHFSLINSYWGNGKTDDTISYIIDCINEITFSLMKKYHTRQQEDCLASFGEIMSSYLVTKSLRDNGISSQQVIATECIVTDRNFTNAEFIPMLTTKKAKQELLPLLSKNIVPVVTGFIGSTKRGETTTLGRGGSDYTAAILGYSLNASEIQIWTDVDGIYTSDPRFVPTASLIEKVTFKEASELATFGAKVLHPRTIRPAISAGLPVRVLNTLNPESTGTVITSSESRLERVTAVASKKHVTLVNLYSTDMLLSKGYLQRVFTIFAQHNISIDLVSVSEVSISVTLDNDENLDPAVKELEEFATVSVSKENGVVSIIGENIVHVPHVMKYIFGVLDYENITVKMISLGASDINISLVITSEHVMSTVQLLHDLFFQKQQKERRMFL